MTGPGEGVTVATQETDGGSVPTAWAAASSGRSATKASGSPYVRRRTPPAATGLPAFVGPARCSKSDSRFIPSEATLGWREHGLKDVLPLLSAASRRAERPAPELRSSIPAPPDPRLLTFCSFRCGISTIRLPNPLSNRLFHLTIFLDRAGAFRPVPRGSFDSWPLWFDCGSIRQDGTICRPIRIKGKRTTHGNRLCRLGQDGRQHGPAPRAGLAGREDQRRPHGRRLRQRPESRPRRGGRRGGGQHARRDGEAAQNARAPCG